MRAWNLFAGARDDGGAAARPACGTTAPPLHKQSLWRPRSATPRTKFVGTPVRWSLRSWLRLPATGARSACGISRLPRPEECSERIIPRAGRIAAAGPGVPSGNAGTVGSMTGCRPAAWWRRRMSESTRVYSGCGATARPACGTTTSPPHKRSLWGPRSIGRYGRGFDCRQPRVPGTRYLRSGVERAPSRVRACGASGLLREATEGIGISRGCPAFPPPQATG